MIKIEKSSAPRVVIGKHLTSLIEKNNKIIVIDNDLGTSTSSADVEKTFPKNFLELGIGEQSSLSAATGLALEGMFPVYVNFAIFASGTIWTQIRQAAYAKANLKIIATHPGLDAGPDGASHQATQDMALMRCIPNMNVILPLDENDVKSAISYALNNKGLYYVRVAREPVPIIYNSPEEANFDIKNKELYSTGDDIALFFDGSSFEQAIASVNLLEENNIKYRLIHVRSLKPLDADNIIEYAKKVKCVITLENHSVIGGLGSAVAEVLSAHKDVAPLRIVGCKDSFTESGKSTELKLKYGVSAQNVFEKVKEVLK
ncbi:transketolase family protein [Brachyspira aalborgi]|uniref:transketolase family protein n=1 Tax=Brachyspira aalborgi TaxID=29522 RepID=UPI0011C6FAF8|nr:transketolase C-terminal domain-containing protein [Brachyspira aalborgi]TXJ48482.1 transketolase [Brachyspira aalborgi]